MNPSPNTTEQGDPRSFPRTVKLLLGALLVAALFLLFTPRKEGLEKSPAVLDSNMEKGTKWSAASLLKPKMHGRTANAKTSRSAEEIISEKLTAFAQNRKQLMLKLAKASNITVKDDVMHFFEVLESGDRAEADKLFDALQKQHNKNPGEIGLAWRPIQEAGGVNWELMNWPAQKVLDYGDQIFGSLKPGMVYIGGTDPGAFLTSFLNETGDGEHHIIMTQNALADSTYLDYLRTVYGEQMQTITGEESQKAFQTYIEDLGQRIDHDEKFPNEPKRVLSSEKYTRENGKLQVSGVTAVMSINEKLIQTLLDKNPGMSFGIEESFPFKSTYSDAAILGPIMQLRAGPEDQILTPAKAADSVSFWRNQTDLLLADNEAATSPYVMKTYSKTATSQANLLLARGFTAESEQTYNLALKLYPGNIETVNGLLDVYSRSGRANEASQLLNDFVQKFPEQKGMAQDFYQSRFGTGAAGGK
ncbi:MAG: hypothetical protein JWN25_2754 [Verrucomicrobiales bacterium]|nr:hypothetical protein [Verrucomicrobiales bacterium]